MQYYIEDVAKLCLCGAYCFDSYTSIVTPVPQRMLCVNAPPDCPVSEGRGGEGRGGEGRGGEGRGGEGRGGEGRGEVGEVR